VRTARPRGRKPPEATGLNGSNQAREEPFDALGGKDLPRDGEMGIRDAIVAATDRFLSPVIPFLGHMLFGHFAHGDFQRGPHLGDVLAQGPQPGLVTAASR
jgi:hypothetical protein